MNPEQNLARQLRDLGNIHAEMAETSDNLTTDLRGLLELGQDVTDPDAQDLEDEVADIAAKHEAAVGQHEDYARFFFGMARLVQSGDWQYTDLKMIHEMMAT